MIDHFKTIIASQFEASLCMLHDCVRKCPREHWDGIVAKYPFWQVVYHTLCFADLYLTESEGAFQFRDIHPKGWAEFNEEYPSRRFEKPELADYVAWCREKAIRSIGAETAESLQGASGFPRLRFSRAELHVYNIRHIQHHTGQLGAYLRRLDQKIDPDWVGAGWRGPRT